LLQLMAALYITELYRAKIGAITSGGLLIGVNQKSNVSQLLV
jgi:hypothetical protein